MKIAYNPKTAAVITAATAVNDDILFDLNARKVWAKGLRMGADWADISSKPSSLKNPAAIKFRDIDGSEVSYDGSVAKDLTTGTYKARLPYGFSSFDSKPTWGNTTGTSIACWNDASGGSIDFRKDNPTSGKLSIKVDGRVYVNEGVNPVLSAESNSGFWGMRTPDGGNDWIRTSNNGLLPYKSGGAGNGSSSLGTNSWYFSTAYIDKVYGSLKGNADTATTATTALKADKLTTARNIALGTDLRGSANFDGSGNITINATINSCQVSVGSKDTLPFKRIAHFETTSSYNDNALLLYISEGYVNGRNGICRIEFRTNNIATSSTSTTASAAVRWLVRNGYGLDSLYAGYYVTANKAYIDVYLKTGDGYRGTVIRVLQDSRGSINSAVQLISAKYNSDTDHKEAYSSVEAAANSLYNKAYTKIVSGVDAGTVNYANSTGSASSATKLQTARNLWGNPFDGTKDISDSIRNLPLEGGIYWDPHAESTTDNSDAASITVVKAGVAGGTTLVLSQQNDANDTIQFKTNASSRLYHNNNYILTSKDTKVTSGKGYINNTEITQVNNANKWTTARTFTIGNTAKNVDGSGDVSWSLAEIGVRDTWRTVQVNGTSIGNNTLNLCNSTYIGLTNVNGKVTFSLVGSSTTANQAILSNGTANGWTLKTLNIANWDTAYNLRHSHANKSVLDGITTGLVTNWNTAYTFVSTITGTDTDNVINKWEEIVNFLAGITEDNKLNTLLGSKLSIQQLSAKDILTTKTNNALFWVNTIDTAGSITTGPFTDHPYALLSVTNYSQNDTNGKFFYRSRLAFSSAGDIKVASCHHQGEYKQDDAWYNVLTSKNSGISGSTIKLNGSSITVYSSDTADGRYVKKSGDTMTGALNFANDTWNKVGDDVAIGDCNVAGCLGIKGLNGDPGLAFYNYSNTLLSKLVGTANQFQRVSGANTYTIIDTASSYITNGVYVFGRSEIGNSPNYDDPQKNGLFEIRGSLEVTGETGTRPTTGYGAFLNLKTPDSIAMLQISGIGNSLYFRARQAASVTMAGVSWKKVLDTGNSYVRDGKGVINGSTITLVDKAIKSDIASKVANSLTLKANGTTLATYDGSSAKEANFTYANVGAASANHNHDNRYVRRWDGVYGSANKFLKLTINDEKGWIRLEVSNSDNATTGCYGVYIIGWGYHGNNNTDDLNVSCLYANNVDYVQALKVVRTSRNNYDIYFQFKNAAAQSAYTVNYCKQSVQSLDYTVTAVSKIPTATWTSSLSALQLNASSATNADKLDGYHANGLLTALSNSNRGISLTVGGTTKSLSNISVGDADTVDGYHATDGRTFKSNINWATNWSDSWSDGTNNHPWYGFDHRYANTGVYSTTLSDYFGLTLKTCSGNISMTTNGNVGIGLFNPTYKLQVQGNVYATSTVTSAGFKHSAVTKNANQYVLTADGGYTFLNQTSNELEHEFSKDITVTSEWTDIEDFYGGSQTFLTQPGTYVVQVYYTTNSANSMYEGYFSGIMSWYTGKTNSNNADEIVLHRVGHAYANTIYLRTMESLKDDSHPYTKLQISANSDLKQHTYKFKFKRIC